ncbi:MAG: hypothetical protein HXN90_08740 [Prevotella pallens]|nr:hypothetical protein [Prevotella pallens]
MNTLRTFREISTFAHENTHEHSVKYLRLPTKFPNEHSARYFYQFIAPVSSTKTIGFGVRNTMCCRNNMACIVLVK